MEKKTISAGIIGAGGFIGQEHLKRLTKQIDGAVVTAWDGVHAEVTSKVIAAGKPGILRKAADNHQGRLRRDRPQ